MGQDLTDDQAGELTKLAAELVARFNLAAAGFCLRHARADPREKDLALVILVEIVMAELIDTKFTGGENPLVLLRHISHNVHGELRSRSQARRAKGGKLDA